jgi:MFS family permease
MNRWFGSTFASFSVPHFGLLWFGSLFAWLAFMMSGTAQGIVAFKLEGTNSAVGLVASGNGIAMLIVAPFGGVVADRFPRRTMLLISQSAIGLAYLAVGVLILSGALTVLLLAALVGLMGLSMAFVGPSRHAYVGELVPKGQLANAVAMNQATVTVARVLGPFVAGGLIALAFIGTSGVYLVMAGLMFTTVATLWRLPVAPRRAGASPSVLGDLKEGFSYAWGNPRIRLLILSFFAMLMVGAPYQTVLPGLLENELGHKASSLGLLLGVSAAGGVLASIVLAGIVGGSRARPTMTGLGFLLGASLIALSLAPSFPVALLVMLPLGAGMTGYQLVNASLLMMEADSRYYGRVMSLNMTAFAAMGLMNFPAGVLADAIGERVVLTLAGCGTIIVMAASTGAWSIFGRRTAAESRAALASGPGGG